MWYTYASFQSQVITFAWEAVLQWEIDEKNPSFNLLYERAPKPPRWVRIFGSFVSASSTIFFKVNHSSRISHLRSRTYSCGNAFNAWKRNQNGWEMMEVAVSSWRVHLNCRSLKTLAETGQSVLSQLGEKGRRWMKGTSLRTCNIWCVVLNSVYASQYTHSHLLSLTSSPCFFSLASSIFFCF